MMLPLLLVCSLTVPAVLSLPGLVIPLGFELSETKEELKLQYDLAVTDHETGRITLVFTLKDDGRLEPIDSINLHIPSNQKHAGGGHKSDLSLALATRMVDGQRVARVHINKELAAKAELHLKTYHLDGKQQPMTWYYHRILFKDYPARKQIRKLPAIEARNLWEGQWHTNWGLMQLELQEGNRLKGTYGSLQHSVEGSFDPERPQVFSGRWEHSDSDLRGRFQFRIAGENRFEGSWTFNDLDPSEHTINWTGKKLEPPAANR